MTKSWLSLTKGLL